MKDPVGKPEDYTPSSPERIDLTIPMEFSGCRLDQALAKLVPEYSRSRIQAWIRQEKVRLEGRACSIKEKVWGGESLSLEPEPDPE